MNRYTEFCRLRDYRAPGTEACKYTEAEAFARAAPAIADAAAVHALIADDRYAATFQTLGQYRSAIKQFIAQHPETPELK